MKHYLVLVLLLSFSSAFASDTIHHSDKSHRIDSLFSYLHQKGRFNGNVLIAEKGKVVYENSFGVANEATGEPLTENSIFELASVSKQFTAMAIVMLKEQGKLTYENTLAKYFPELPLYKEVTIRQLLNHTSGIPDYLAIADSAWDKSKMLTNHTLVDLLSKLHIPLEFEPGTNHEYSNTNYALLALIIEQASGEHYSHFLQHHIFNPLKMNNTFVYTRRYAPHTVEHYAYGYVYSDSLKRLVLPDSLAQYQRVRFDDGVLGHSMVNSTVTDLLKWDRALYKNTLASKQSTQDVFTSGILKNGKEAHYGFGWMLDRDSLIGRMAAHTGGWPGYVAFIERHLDSDKTIIILQNHYLNAEIPYKEIRAILYNQPLPKPLVEEIELPVDSLRKFEGTYQMQSGRLIKVFLVQKTLDMQFPPQEAFPIYPKSTHEFFLEGESISISFVENQLLQIEKLVIHQNGNDIQAIKMKLH